jgi:hypothetical protein
MCSINTFIALFGLLGNLNNIYINNYHTLYSDSSKGFFTGTYYSLEKLVHQFSKEDLPQF